MKPLPPCLQAMFPANDVMFTARPWWGPGEFHYVRRDGAQVTTYDRMETVDRTQPLPHPGYRVGQVWALVDEDMDVVYYAVQIIGLPDADLIARLQGAYLMADPACPHLAPWAP